MKSTEPTIINVVRSLDEPPLTVQARRLVFSVLPLLVLVAGAEFAARAVGHEDEFASHSGFVIADPDLLWKLRPTKSGPLATNGLGLRDGPYRPDADAKILVLGDSVSWGNGIRDRALIFPEVLERELEASRPGTSFEVINSGVPGYSTFQEHDYLLRDGLALEPDLIVLQFCLNDATERYRALAEYGGNRNFLGVDTREFVGGLYGLALRNSRAVERMVRWLQHRSRDYDEYRGKHLAVDQLSPENERAWAQVLVEIAAIFETARSREIPLLLLIAPYRFQVENPRTMRQPQDRLLAFAKDRGFEALDLIPAFVRAAAGRPALLFSDVNHFSAAGHAVAAAALKPAVLSLLDNPPPSPGRTGETREGMNAPPLAAKDRTPGDASRSAGI